MPGQPLVLPNVWDAATAAIVAAAGFPAAATSSAAVAESLGHRDGGGAPPDEMFGAIARICAAVDVPVTADVETGYGLGPADLVGRLINTSAVGCNVEDSAFEAGLVDATEQAEFIAAMRDAAGQVGVPIVINARIDVFLDPGPHQSPIDESVRRGRLYLEAGADCVFPILASGSDAIRALVTGIGGPVNILCRPPAAEHSVTREPGLSSDELAALGVARISYGAGLFREAMARFAETVRGEVQQIAPRKS